MLETMVNNSPAATQIKVSVKPEVALAFKATCKANDTSMVAVLSDFMIQYSKVAAQKGGYAPNLSRRKHRRVAMQSIIRQVERIRENEERYRDNIPTNLQGSSPFEIADQSLSTLDEVLDLLALVY